MTKDERATMVRAYRRAARILQQESKKWFPQNAEERALGVVAKELRNRAEKLEAKDRRALRAGTKQPPTPEQIMNEKNPCVPPSEFEPDTCKKLKLIWLTSIKHGRQHLFSEQQIKESARSAPRDHLSACGTFVWDPQPPQDAVDAKCRRCLKVEKQAQK